MLLTHIHYIRLCYPNCIHSALDVQHRQRAQLHRVVLIDYLVAQWPINTYRSLGPTLGVDCLLTSDPGRACIVKGLCVRRHQRIFCLLHVKHVRYEVPVGTRPRARRLRYSRDGHPSKYKLRWKLLNFVDRNQRRTASAILPAL
jgi:hypothetical protein